MSTVALVPAYRRADRVGATVNGLLALVDEVVVIDDGSADGGATAGAAQRAGASVVALPVNRGKGGALAAGIAASPGATTYLLVDADTADTAGATAPLLDAVAGGADLAIGVLPPAAGRGGFGTVRNLAAWGIRRACGFEAAAPLSGQRAVRASLLRSLEPADRFGVEAGMTIDAVRAGAQVVEVPIEVDHAHTGRSVAGFSHRAAQGWDLVRALWPRLLAERTRLLVLVGAAVLVVGVLAAGGAAAVPTGAPLERAERVVLVAAPPTLRLDDLDDPRRPELAALAGHRGAVAAANVDVPGRSPWSSWASVGAGAEVRAGPPSKPPDPKQPFLVQDVVDGQGRLGDALRQAGRTTAFVGTDPTSPVRLAVADGDGRIDRAATASIGVGGLVNRARTDVSAGVSVVAVDATGLGPSDLDLLLDGLRTGAERQLLLVVTPADRRARLGLRPFVAAGPGAPAGRLVSPSTRRDGLVVLSDVAPTILDVLGMPAADGMVGRPVRHLARAPDVPGLVQDDRRARQRDTVWDPALLAIVPLHFAVYGWGWSRHRRRADRAERAAAEQPGGAPDEAAAVARLDRDSVERDAVIGREAEREPRPAGTSGDQQDAQASEAPHRRISAGADAGVPNPGSSVTSGDGQYVQAGVAPRSRIPAEGDEGVPSPGPVGSAGSSSDGQEGPVGVAPRSRIPAEGDDGVPSPGPVGSAGSSGEGHDVQAGVAPGSGIAAEGDEGDPTSRPSDSSVAVPDVPASALRNGRGPEEGDEPARPTESRSPVGDDPARGGFGGAEGLLPVDQPDDAFVGSRGAAGPADESDGSVEHGLPAEVLLPGESAADRLDAAPASDTREVAAPQRVGGSAGAGGGGGPSVTYVEGGGAAIGGAEPAEHGREPRRAWPAAVDELPLAPAAGGALPPAPAGDAGHGGGFARQALLHLGLGLVAWPLATWLVRAVPGTASLGRWAGLLALAVDAAVVVVALRRGRGLAPLAVVLGATVALVTVDLGFGGPLQLSSAFGGAAHSTGRFTGLGNTAFAVYAASALLAVACGCRRAPWMVALLVLVALADALPSLGGDVGGVLTLVPIFSLAVAALWGRLRWRTVLLAGAATALVLGVALAVDLSRPPDARTHLARFVTGGGTSSSIGGKIDQILDTYAAIPALAAVVAITVGFALLLWRRRFLTALPPGSPARIGVAAALGVALVGNVLNDSGPIVTLLAMSIIAPSLVVRSVAAEQPPRKILPPGPDPRPLSAAS